MMITITIIGIEHLGFLRDQESISPSSNQTLYTFPQSKKSREQ